MESNLPLARVKKISKFSLAETSTNPSIIKNTISAEAVNLLAIATVNKYFYFY